MGHLDSWRTEDPVTDIVRPGRASHISVDGVLSPLRPGGRRLLWYQAAGFLSHHRLERAKSSRMRRFGQIISLLCPLLYLFRARAVSIRIGVSSKRCLAQLLAQLISVHARSITSRMNKDAQGRLCCSNRSSAWLSGKVWGLKPGFFQGIGQQLGNDRSSSTISTLSSAIRYAPACSGFMLQAALDVKNNPFRHVLGVVGDPLRILTD